MTSVRLCLIMMQSIECCLCSRAYELIGAPFRVGNHSLIKTKNIVYNEMIDNLLICDHAADWIVGN